MNVQDKRSEILSRMTRGDAEEHKALPERTAPEPIAVIGLSGSFPGCRNVLEFWDALDQDRSLIERIPEGRIDWKGEAPVTKWAGIVPGIDHFDPGFFNILPGEAALMDPRKRLLLMSVYHAMEDAGYAPASLKETRTGVFVAIEEDEYGQCLQEAGMDTKACYGNSSSLIANEISYFFDLRGPSEVINTMCSGGAIAIHRAIGALRKGEISLAVVGGANLLLHRDPFIFLSRSGQMSLHASVKSFGKGADGFLRADGVASLILKPLSRAVEDGDPIYAVIRNTAVNYNGRSGLSMAAPNITSHADLIVSCYREAGIHPARLGYIEAQGMGNPVADLAEWEAFNRALKTMATEKGFSLENGNCRVSTLKPMTGHMHSVSALAALFKVIRSFHTNKIHKIIGLSAINADLDTKDRPCRLLMDTEPWELQAHPRLAAVHSYGSGGNNAHLLIEEYKDQEPEEGKAEYYSGREIFPFSGATTMQCRTLLQRFVEFISEYPGLSFSCLAHTLQTGRDVFKHRVVFAAANRQELIEKIRLYLDNGLLDEYLPSEAREWVEGGAKPWDRRMGKHQLRRIHLPGYPFDCQSYWIPAGGHSSIKGRPQMVELEIEEPVAGTEEGVAERIVREVLGGLMGKAPGDIDLDSQFSDLGFNSMLVTRITYQLSRQYGLEIASSILFEQLSPRQLIHFIGREYKDQLSGPAKPPDIIKQKRFVKMGKESSPDNQPIAIIGVSGNFPQAASVDLLWHQLVSGSNCIQEVPKDRWSIDGHFHPDKETANKAGKSYAKWGGFLKDFYFFDPLFFNIPPAETEWMSPKERLFLQGAWHVLEDAGYTPHSLADEKVGVFAGVTRGGIDPYKTSPFTISNRVSYVLNLNGPSMTIDTACSSSLVAIHEACQHIRAGECSLALAGGVHVFLDPSHFSVLSGMYMLSPDGVCRSFGDRANGMVPGEGLGVLFLKPLDRAVRDGDHIYGVIRGSAINHGGKTNGFTVPNPRAHQDLVQAALRKAGINARDISYVEAHGTGTPLGDPIEIRGLTEAFKADTDDTQYCRIGSIKSNIGHLEAAAGVSGLIKVLLQMKHKKLAPSLHSRNTNPEINFLKTPFIVQQSAEDWQPTDRLGNKIPRIACVSSFGAGGANAHIILEEYCGTAVREEPSGGSFPVPLSAKTGDRLIEQARQLLTFLHQRAAADNLSLADLAYTLHVGRVAFEEKLLIETASLKELEDKLDAFLEGNGRSEARRDGNGKRGNVNPGLADPALFKDRPGRRISLPGYPFLKEHYGLPGITAGRPLVLQAANKIHPLVHTNISTFLEQKFCTLLTGEEFFLRDHIINGEKFLPGVAYLEIVYAAMELASGDGEWAHCEGKTPGTIGIQLKNVVWIQPAIIRDEPIRIQIGFSPEEGGEKNFEICGGREASGLSMMTAAPTPEKRILSRGSALLVVAGEAPILDINALLKIPDPVIVTKTAVYDQFARMGINYGPSHMGIEQLYIWQDSILASIMLPPGVSGGGDQFRLHPGMLDAALQSIVGFLIRDKEKYPDELPLPIPFALEELTVYSPTTENMWACIRMNGPAGLTGNIRDFDNLSFDIDLTDDAGKVCVRLMKYTARVLRTGIGAPTETLLILPSWEAMEDPEKDPATGKDPLADHFGQRIVICCDETTAAFKTISDRSGTQQQVLRLRSRKARMEERIGDYTIKLVAAIRQILQDKPKADILLQLLAPGAGEGRMITALYSLLKTAELENPHICAALVRSEDGKTVRRVLKEVVATGGDTRQPWNSQGIYLITGGLGGVGTIIAKEILGQVPDATLILTGRSPLDELKKEKLEELSLRGRKVEYRQADVSVREDMNLLIADICRVHGGLHGVIHCAGSINDSFILRKTDEGVAAVLAPKIAGMVNLDLATKDLDLDIFLVCSSSSSIMGNIGQADYAVANAFMDEYAHYRNSMVSKKERKGHTVAINWPLWKEAGMKVDEQTRARMFDTIGMVPLETSSGLQAMYQAIAHRSGQMMVMRGDAARLRKAFFAEPVLQHAAHREKEIVEITDNIRDKAISYFKRLLSRAIKLPAERIDPGTPLEQYGIDSIMVMHMTAELEKVFGSLSKTLFFEYRDIGELTGYFIGYHAEKLDKLLGTGRTTKTKDKQPVDTRSRPDRFTVFSTPSPIALAPAEKIGSLPLDIAIIGLSGHYPQARNLQEFWDNLRSGRNSITQIPAARWNHNQYFDPDKNKKWRTYSKWGGFLEEVNEFDALFFNISPREAEILDPQERLFLQCVYECMEDAGYTRQLLEESVQGRVGVYAGVMWTEYQLYGAQETALGRPLALSSSAASIANRISYYCNFNGPSLALDTMCSSSLTAIHLACQSLIQGECAVAIAGGVNVSIHPNKYLVLGYGKLASSKGLCESFGAGGDGYVPGEGVGAALLKPLSQAIADGDHIYGIIKGSAINHGGKVNGYAVPNPRAQAQAVQRALAGAGFDPRTISYVEAHGTGTALGDPIEIAGLTTGFQSNDKQFCAIGSVKSNIGHCESAAGIAGVTKVLLQMKHRQLAPSLHSSVLNPNIDFAASPFMVQQDLAEWKRPVLDLNGNTWECPRRAGISSFGAGGANAHLIIEEYIPESFHKHHRPRAAPPDADQTVAILLSARNEDRLKESARQLSAALLSNGYGDKDLVNIAYTLQVGREVMEERLGVEISSMDDLNEKLARFIRGESNIENLHQGKIHGNKDIMSIFQSDDDMGMAVDTWLKKKKYPKLLAIWANGFNVDWRKLYVEHRESGCPPQRISLPTYPFLPTRYWPIGEDRQTASRVLTVTHERLHPLVHRNVSTFAEQKFSSTFSGEEFFLKDHMVNGEKLMPGVAYLEMINEAMILAKGERKGSMANRPGLRLENMVWATPVMVNGHPETVEIGLVPAAGGEVHFEICSDSGTEGKRPVIHSQGTARYMEETGDPVLDIESIRKGIGVKIMDTDACYALFAKMGIVYGPSQRGIESIYAGEGQLLAKLSLPPAVKSTLDEYCLHPSLMDASLQAVIGFLAGEYTTLEAPPLAIPFAIRALKVIRPCTRDMWALIRHSQEQRPSLRSEGQQLSFDIDICDPAGKICVQIEGFSSRVIKKGVSSVKGRSVPKNRNALLIEPCWQPEEAIHRNADTDPAATIPWASHTVIVIENNELAGSLSRQIPGIRCLALDHTYSTIAEGFEQFALDIFKEVKQLLASRPKEPVLMQVVTPFEDEKQVLLAVAGLLKTARLENSFFSGQVIGIGRGADNRDTIRKIMESAKVPDDVIRYIKGKRESFRLREFLHPAEHPEPIWQDGGVYLITGGAGGLGLIFAKEAARKTIGATIILAGRSQLNTETERKIEEVRAMGITVAYHSMDITDGVATADLVEHIVQEYGHLHGVIHCAGVIRDNFILKKTEKEISAVFAPKIQGITNIDLATRGIDLRFFILCSSSTGVTGNMGQADYAMANAYMDRFAAYRHSLSIAGKRSGKTLSMNWPLWQEGGMHVTKAQEEALLETIGMTPLETEAGLRALYQAMAAEVTQMMVVQGQEENIRTAFLASELSMKASPAAVNGAPATDSRTNRRTDNKTDIMDLLKKVMSGVIQLPADQINADKPMDEYGIDSVMVMQMTAELEKEFGSLSKTLFFEYQNLRELTDYFSQTFPEKFMKQPDKAQSAPVAPSRITTARVTEAPNLMVTAQATEASHRFAGMPVQSPEKKPLDGPLDIAIVGLSGRYPQAKDLNAFWEVLKEGRNCIIEIPRDRWDQELYFDAERNKLGKSYSKWGGFLEGVDEFDPLFFGISAREAESLDPQERLFLQCAYETLEDAGYDRATVGYNKERGLVGNVGVYVGVMWQEYQLYGAQETALGRPLTLSGVSASIANRVSYFCNFNGLSITLNTMCSSSLTAIHLACQSIRAGECSAAIAGGVNLSLHPNKYMSLGYGNFLSGRGLCESFGAEAEGYVPGEGVGAVLLKPLSLAIEDGDHIYAVIKGSAVNHGGRTNSYTVPNPKAQADVIKRAVKMAAFDPETVSYVEAQGTGTMLGDSIEITGLNRAFETKRKNFCPIGSVKSNIGHCESASGIASLTKVLLQMKHRQLAPSLHSRELNPNIDFENSPFTVQQELAEWKRPVLDLNGTAKEYPRRAGVSAFGAGGANAHLLVEEWVQEYRSDPGEEARRDSPVLILLSARNPSQLKEVAERLRNWVVELTDRSMQGLRDMAYTLQVGREPMKERLAFKVISFPDLEERLRQFGTGEITNDMYTGQVYGSTENDHEPVEDWIAAGAYDRLLDAWTKGVSVQWQKLYKGRRVPLPTYPFSRERYWMPAATDPEHLKSAGSGPVEIAGTAAPTPSLPPNPLPVSPDQGGEDPALPRLERRLQHLFAGIVKYRIDQIDPREPLFNYGIDSIMIQLFNGKLADIFGHLPASLPYDHPTLESLAGYLAEHHRVASGKWADTDQ
jgi:polyketide synthase PksN